MTIQQNIPKTPQDANTPKGGRMVALMGPTACGKTALAIALSLAFPMDIISVDSALVYRGMNIGTAKPTANELQLTPHRLIDLCDPADSYSVGQFCTDATREIQGILSTQRTPLLVGGTMLYFHQLFFGLGELPSADQKIRDQLMQEAEKIGWAAMHKKLSEVDPIAAQKIKPQDPQRIQRALEVFLLTGKPISTLQKKQQHFFSKDDVTFIALMPKDRAWLHQRIADRFEKMLAEGFIDEVQALKNRGDLHLNLPSMRVVGYRQVWEYLEGKYDYDTMKEKAIVATRQLAKRQMTWLRRWKEVIILDPQDVNIHARCRALFFNIL